MKRYLFLIFIALFKVRTATGHCLEILRTEIDTIPSQLQELYWQLFCQIQGANRDIENTMKQLESTG